MAFDRCADCGLAFRSLALRSTRGNRTRDGSGRTMCSQCAHFRRERYRERGR